jgi:hypothetical protein
MHFHVRQKLPEKITQLVTRWKEFISILLFGADEECAEVAFELCSWLRLVVAFVQLEFVHPANERTLLATETLLSFRRLLWRWFLLLLVLVCVVSTDVLQDLLFVCSSVIAFLTPP